MVTVRDFLRELSTAWITERPSRQAAALAYYGMFSFAPMLYIVIKVAGLFIDELALADELVVRLTDLLGDETAAYIQQTVMGVSQRSTSNNIVSYLVGLGALLYAATGLFAQLKYSLNVIWQVPTQTTAGMKGFVTTRLLAFAMVLGTGLILILALLGSFAGDFLTTFLGYEGKLFTGNSVTFIVLATLCFTLLYKILPDTKTAWSDLWLGALIAALLFTIGRWALGIYFSHSNISSAFAAAGALAIVVITINYSAQIFLFGALFGRVYAMKYGSLAGQWRLGPTRSRTKAIRQ